MRPAPFRYFAPRSAGEARALLAEHKGEARLLAGGQSLVPLMNLRLSRPEVLIDLNRCDDLRFIEKRGGEIVYGAMTRQIDAQNSPLTYRHCRLVSEALMLGGPVAIRSSGTVGGVLAHADRSAELPAVAVALDAIFVIDGINGYRETPADRFFVDDLTTDVGEGEMLCEVRVPIQDCNAYTAFVEAGTRQRDMAVAGLAAQLSMSSGGNCRRARLAVIGVGPRPLRLRTIEDSLSGQRLERALIDALAQRSSELIDSISDLHATADYRRHVTGALLAQVLERAASHGEHPNDERIL